MNTVSKSALEPESQNECDMQVCNYKPRGMTMYQHASVSNSQRQRLCSVSLINNFAVPVLQTSLTVLKPHELQHAKLVSTLLLSHLQRQVSNAADRFWFK